MPDDVNGKYQAMKFAEWKGAIGERVENMDDRLVRVESKLDKLIPKVAGIGATIALIVTILVLLTRSAFGTLTDFSYADADTVIADKETIIYDYHFKIYRTDTIASWAIQVDNYENFACYIEGHSLPHADSFAIAALYYQSGTYDSLFTRVPGYERSILDTAITDPAGEWHTFYPLLKYVKIYIYGDTIGTAANPVSDVDSNTVKVRIRLSKWKGTQMKIPGTGLYTHHHPTFYKPVDFRDSVTFYALTFPAGVPYPALRWSPYHKMLYPLTDLDVNLGDGSHRYAAVYSRYLYLNATAVLDGVTAGEIGANATIVSTDATAAVSAQPNSYPFNVVGYPTSGVYFERTDAKDGAGLLFDSRRVGSEFPDWRRDGLGAGLMGKIRFRGGGSEFFTVDVLGANKGDAIFYDKTSAKYMHWDAGNRILHLTSNQGARLELGTASELKIFANNNLRLATDGVTGDIWFDNDFLPTTDKAMDLGSRTKAIDTLYYDGIVDMTCVFEGTGEEALEILQTLEKDSQTEHSPDYGKLDPYLNANNAIHFDRLVYVLAAAVKELEKDNQLLRNRIKKMEQSLSPYPLDPGECLVPQYQYEATDLRY